MRSALKWFQNPNSSNDSKEEAVTNPSPRLVSVSASAAAATARDCDSTAHTHFAAADTDSPGSLNSASLTQSPSPQPETPTDHFMSGAGSATTFSKPITISTPPRYETTSSHLHPDDQICALSNHLYTDGFIDMTTGPTLDPSSMGRPRENSFVSAGPKPISVNNSNRENVNRNRRESLAGSLMGGMSWGGMSFGSFVRDE